VVVGSIPTSGVRDNIPVEAVRREVSSLKAFGELSDIHIIPDFLVDTTMLTPRGEPPLGDLQNHAGA
jgi:hypothetical protein